MLLLIVKIKKVWLSVNGAYVSGDNPETGAGGLQDVSGIGAMPDGESIQL